MARTLGPCDTVVGGTNGDMGIFRRSKPTGRKAGFIDLREGPAQPAPTPSRREVWARSNPCPLCRGIGYLDHIDMTKRVMFQHCLACGHTWETTEASCTTR